MSLTVALAIGIPVAFVVGTVYNAIKAQKRLEGGTLRKVLSEREAKGCLERGQGAAGGQPPLAPKSPGTPPRDDD